MDREFISAFIAIFVVLLLFMILNTVMGGFIFPILDDVGQNMTLINQTTFPAQSDLFQNAFYFAFFIIIIIPFIFIFVKILTREPEPQAIGGGF